MKKNCFAITILVCFALCFFTACGKKEIVESKSDEVIIEENVPLTKTTESEDASKKITILYTNDVHTYVNNCEEDDNSHMLLNYASVAALKKDIAADGENVVLVDVGDHVQGTAYGALDEGITIIDMMNAVGYDVATLGNHEFDYGQFRVFKTIEQAHYPYVSCNFYNVEDGSLVLPAYQIIEKDGVKVAFIGISTPETIFKSTPAYFQNKDGEFIYNFYSGADGQELYDSVQRAIDEVKPQVDFVVALGHLGVDASSEPYTSINVIENVEGLDAFIDGHSHSVIEAMNVKDKAGEDVVLTSTGSYLESIGQMTIENGKITTKLITEYENYDEEIMTMTNALVSYVEDALGAQIAVLDNTLYTMDPETNVRIVRSQETNAGDFLADAFYYYINDVIDLNCDVVFVNGGGVRSSLNNGPLTYFNIKEVNPFGNFACLVEVKGQDIIEVLEAGVRNVGNNSEDDTPAECGSFMSVAGMKYSINSSIESTVSLSNDGSWISGPSGEYKVNDIEIYNKDTKSYEPINPEKIYTVGGYNYILRNQGDGLTMLADTVCIQDYILQDYLVIAEYAQSFKKGDDGYAHINTENSPLSSYEGYLIDYENPYGAGRILISVE